MDSDKVRISKIGGQYLIFDVKDVARIRRNHSICAILVGTTPQAPTQNIFTSLPLELKPEEARLLVEKDAAFIEDDYTAHVTQLRDPAARKAYADTLRSQREALKAAQAEGMAARKAQSSKARANQERKGGKGAKKRNEASASGETATAKPLDPEESLFDAPPPPAQTPSSKQPRVDNPVFTPTTSAGLLDPGTHTEEPEQTSKSALQSHLNAKNYFMTPGLRFGGHFSAYPGDPFRYHAHFMATSYDWDEPIGILDLVGGGRLATGVKKGFLFGAEKPGEGSGDVEGKNVRAFTLEWAAI